MVMGFIPMPHTVAIANGVAEDDWGISSPAEETEEVNARLSYNSSRETLPLSSGEEIVFTASVLLEGLPYVDYDSFIIWEDDFGTEHKSEPLDIQYKKDLAGNNIAVRVLI